ncbi:hypothetical protein [Paenirhodobacter populi]|uniref:Uncharacterized protein n=1 Tax=Paenirhodobacter populi TaxID=2306993 RepID=A0A443JJP8_9RHOB|nr:hypothetical protein [Sinirhodobacter populi]RWR20815.1 hypothetical protein D2T30_10610 [Sinirhodobacter populi]
MDDGIAQDIATELEDIAKKLAKQNELREESNDLHRSLIPVLQAVAQELLELRKHLADEGPASAKHDEAR